MLKKFIQTALLLVVLCTTATTYAQVSQAPDGIQFQALATDANGHPAAGRVIYVKDGIVAKHKVVLFGGATGDTGKYSMTGETFLYNVLSKNWQKL